jgi:CheY-like chemotaxis protein
MAERIESIRAMLGSTIGSSVKLVAAIEPEIWPVKVDANELELAMVNVALNARDAMPDGGVISITAENITLSRRDTSANLEGDFVALRVSDTGSGIAADVLPRVFDPFFTTKQVSKGSGLGLSQVHGFAHQSGGTVAIDSELGRGTTVTLYLPRTHESASQEQTGPEQEMESAGEGTVLLVEDNPDVADVEVKMLEQLGYKVHDVRDARAALEVIDNREFDLVISDVVMPGDVDGLGLARAIRERKPSLPVLLVTGYSHPGGSELAAEFTIIRPSS